MTNSDEEKTKTASNSLDREIKEFVSTLPVWGQFLAQKILEEIPLSDDIIDEAYKQFRINLGLSGIGVSSTVIGSNQDSSNSGQKQSLDTLTLVSLEHIEGVNALHEKQTIPFSDTLTIIYGSNGSGKSGFCRILKNSFLSKSAENIIQDINNLTPKSPVAKFTFKNLTSEYSLNYPTDCNHSEFDCFSFFDSHTAKIHLDEKNEFSFKPAALNLFSELARAYDKMSSKLHEDLSSRKTKDYSQTFVNDSELKEEIKQISSSTNTADLLRRYSIKEPTDSENLASLQSEKAKLLLMKKETAIAELTSNIATLSEKRAALEEIESLCTDNYSKLIDSMLEDYDAQALLAQSQSIDRFQSKVVRGIGTNDWKSFIEAGHKVAVLQQEGKLDGDVEYPKDSDSCLFCHQPLSAEASALISAYWQYLKGEAAQSVDKLNASINEIKSKLSELDFDIFPENDTFSVAIKSLAPEQVVAIQTELVDREDLIGKLSKRVTMRLPRRNLPSLLDNATALSGGIRSSIIQAIDEIEIKLKAELELLKQLDPNKELKKIEEQITLIFHKQAFASLYPQIQQYVGKLNFKGSRE